MTWFRCSLAFAFAIGVVNSSEVFAAGEGYRSDPSQAFVKLFLEKHCLSCHGSEKAKGGLRLDKLQPDPAGPEAQTWNKVRSRLVAGEMPPKSQPQPGKDEKRQVLTWLTQGLTAANIMVAPAPPELGNRTDHSLLFHPDRAKAVTASPARSWRISPEIYLQFLLDLDPMILSDRRLLAKFHARYSQPFASDTGSGFQDYSGSFTIDEQTADLLIRNARELAACQTAWQEAKDGGTPVIRNGMLVPRYGAYKGMGPVLMAVVNQAAPPSKQQMEAAIRTQFRLVVQRQPTEKELAQFVALMERNVSEAGKVEGARTTLATVALLREVIFRSEEGKGPPDKYGRYLLTPRELAFAVAFALTDKRPDAILLRSAEDGKLATREEVKKQVERLLNDSTIQKPRILRFFQQYFGYAQASQAFKDQAAISAFTKALGGQKFRYLPDVLVHDTNMLVEHILEKDQNVLHELLTTNKVFINYDKARPSAPFKSYAKRSDTEAPYNLSDWPGANQPVRLPAEQRAGILTQPSWLAVHSFNDQTDPIHRGKWVRENLLGEALPDLPLDVDATIPADAKKTMRERLEHTKQNYCWQCHQKMNPLGLTLEMYDHFGRFRPTELAKPVDATGQVEGTGEAKVDGPVNNAVEMMHKLARSTRVRQVFIRHAFRYWMGRAETLMDAPTLIAADRVYVESGGSMKALITSLLTSDTFLYRVPIGNQLKQ